MTAEVLEVAASLGVGGILAAGMFLVYRKDMREAELRIERMQDNTILVAGRVLDAVTNLAHHTAALTVVLRRLDVTGRPRGTVETETRP